MPRITIECVSDVNVRDWTAPIVLCGSDVPFSMFYLFYERSANSSHPSRYTSAGKAISCFKYSVK